MKKLFEWLMGFSFLCLFTLLIFIISLIFDNLTVSQLLMNFGEIAICAWALYFGAKFVELYNKKQEQDRLSKIKEEDDDVIPDPIMICEDKNDKYRHCENDF